MKLIVDIEKKIGNFQLNTQFVATNETLAILGASGCGKSMTLKCIAGVEIPDHGQIILDDTILFDSKKKINLPARKRRAGYLFQDYALFPNMTVAQNIASGIPKNRDNKKQIVQDKITTFYLSGLENQFPSQLSGGQQQRVALARMLASEPEMIMLDEPFSALDSFLKWQLEQELFRIKESFDGTILYVSHNRDEVYRFCDRVIVMENGESQNALEKKQLFSHPMTLSATLLTGCKNVSRAKKTGKYTLFAEDWNAHLKYYKPVMTDLQHVGFRAHYFDIADNADEHNTIECHVTKVIEDLFSVIVIAKVKDTEEKNEWSFLRYELSKEKWARLDDPKTIFLKLNEQKLILMK